MTAETNSFGFFSIAIDKTPPSITPLSIKEKKILGSSIYRTKDKIFYQAVLNISQGTELFERYLKHPKKEPDYRKGRNHNDFVTSIRAEGYILDTISVIQAIKPLFI